MIWTGERVVALKQLWNRGLSFRQIAEKLGFGITRDAVAGKVHRLKLTRKNHPPHTRHDISSAAQH